MKHHNPETPILIREATGIEPKLWARYGMILDKMQGLVLTLAVAFGKEKSVSLSGTSSTFRKARPQLIAIQVNQIKRSKIQSLAL